jgi:hypothetical protein
MDALNYDESIVLILFAQANGGSDPTKGNVLAFDAELFGDFDAVLTEIAAEEGLALDKATRSLLLGCRPFMSGDTDEEQIRNACQYVRAARQP